MSEIVNSTRSGNPSAACQLSRHCAIGEAIVALSKEQGFDMVLGTGVVFASEKVDITDQVIARLKKGGAAK